MVRHILTRIGFTTGEIMVCLIVNGTKKQLKHIDKLVDDLKTIEGMTSIIVNTNTDKTNKFLGLRFETVWGQDYIEDYIGNIKYQIGPLSFYQVNPAQTEKLYGTALESAGLTGGETVWDLYCGIGTISLFLAQKAKQVVVQKIREEERKVLFEQYYEKEHDIVTGMVQRYNNGNYNVNIGKIDAVLTKQEQVPSEHFEAHDRIKLYVTEVKDTPRGPRIVISRTSGTGKTFV